MQVSIIDLVHDLSVNLSKLAVCLIAMLSQKLNHRPELKKNRLLINLEVSFRLAQVVKLRDEVVASSRNNFEF